MNKLFDMPFRVRPSNYLSRVLHKQGDMAYTVDKQAELEAIA